jgi:lactate dehydrogenase-like 2-hydroxyacid dehydrogenase
MQIIVLNANECFLTPDHLNRLKRLGDVSCYTDSDSEEKVIERLKNVDIAIIDGFITPLTKRVFESTNNLKLVILNKTGYDFIDKNIVQQKNIKVANLPGYSTEAVAEQAIALMFAVARHVIQGDKAVRNGLIEVDPANKQHQHNHMGFDLKGKTLGVIGLGTIGTRVAELGNALGMKVVGYNHKPKDVPGVTMSSLEDLLKNSDVISINLALVPETDNFISEKELNLMKPTAIIINTARGRHINTHALYEALKNGKIAGAGLGVLDKLEDNHPLYSLENVVFSPHSGFFTQESLNNMAEGIVDNVESFVKGTPKNIVI